MNQVQLLSKKQLDAQGIIVPSCNILGTFFPVEA